jgi:hypothetical protein
VLLQRKGVAAFVILTESFGDQIDRVMTYHKSDTPLPAVVIDHPMQNVSPAELRQRAEQIADAAERLLRGERP